MPNSDEQPGGFVTGPAGRYLRPEGDLGLSTQADEVVEPADLERARTWPERHREAFDTTGDAVVTFAEGVTDALSWGLIRDRGEAADVRRDVNSGSALLGEIGGIALGLGLPTGLSRVAAVGEGAGRAAARAVFGEGELALALGGRALGEAGAGAAVMGAGAASHQFWDAVIEDKPFAVEAIMHEAGAGALLGGVVGLLGGVFARGASAAEVAEGAGLEHLNEQAARKFDEAVAGHELALETNTKRLGVLQNEVEAGVISPEFLSERQGLLNEASRARLELGEAGSAAAALSSGDATVASKWVAAYDKLESAVTTLDRSMAPKHLEIAPSVVAEPYSPVRPGTSEATYPNPPPDLDAAEMANAPGGMTSNAVELNARMAANPADRAAYEQTHGVPWEPLQPVPGEPRHELATPRRTPSSERETTPGGGAVVSPEQTAKQFVEFTSRAEREANLTRAERHAKLINDWANESRNRLEATPGQNAASALDAHLADLRKVTGGRLDSAGATDLARASGLPPSSTELGSRFQQVWAVNRATEVAAEVSRAGVTGTGGGTLGWMKRRAAGKLGAAVLGAAVGHTVGGPAGYLLGAALASKYISMGGRVAGSVARASALVSKTGEALLRGRRALVATRTIAGNRPWAYSESGPIADPMTRWQEVQRLAAHPEAITAKVVASIGDLTVVQPEVARGLVDLAKSRVAAMAIRAPKFVWDKLGRPLNPPAGEVRRALEFENAMNDFAGTLANFAKGAVTPDMAAGFKIGWPAGADRLMRQLLSDHSALVDGPPARRRAVELLTGVSLTGATDGPAAGRQQMSWAEAKATTAAKSGPQSKAQAFKISQPRKFPTAAPTPSQSYDLTGRAPGN